MSHFYGYIKDKPDTRDFMFHMVQKVEQLPPMVDLRQYCSPVRDQGQLGSCTAFSMATGLREFIEKRSTKRLTILSPMFMYYEERKLEGTIGEDSGAEIRDGMKVLSSLGVSPEYDDKYAISKFVKAPTKTALKDAIRFKTIVYSRLTTLNSMKSCLAAGNGLVFGFNMYESFESDAVAKTGMMPMPKFSEQLLGGHAVFVVGYDDSKKVLIIKNSWGASWGDKGYFYMPYDFASNPNEVSDIWTASK
jgi:C1A family cysteine protease